MNKKTIFQKLMAIFFMPVVIYLVMLFVTIGNGNSYNIFNGSTSMIILKKTSYMTIIALGIGFQLGYGRFDFSGGAITVLSAMIAGKICYSAGLGVGMLLLISILCAMVFSVIHSLIYIKVRVPISVISLGTSFLLESFSGLIMDKTYNLTVVPKLAKLYNSALVIIPLVLACAACFIFQKYTVWGRQANLLSKKQSAAVNIGINEKKNTIICYLISGFVFGCAASLYAVSNFMDSITAPLSTAGTLFGNIIPSLVGLFLSRFIDPTAGTLIGALSIQLLYTGLDSNGISGGVKTICYAIFLAIFIFISGFWDQIVIFVKAQMQKLKQKIKKDKPHDEMIE